MAFIQSYEGEEYAPVRNDGRFDGIGLCLQPSGRLDISTEEEIMSIRINSVIGYAIFDVKSDDKRIDFGVLESLVSDYDTTTDGLESYISQKYKNAVSLSEFNLNSVDKLLLRDFMVVNKSMPSALMFTLPFSKGWWSRRDSPIDYYRHAVDHPDGSTVSELLRIPGTLYPYNGYVNIRTLETVKQHVGERLVKSGCNDWIPIIPQDIIDFCEYTGIFSNHNVIFELRPALFYFWD